MHLDMHAQVKRSHSLACIMEGSTSLACVTRSLETITQLFTIRAEVHSYHMRNISTKQGISKA